MAEVEKVCTRVLFLNEGKIQAEGTPKELARRVKRWTINLKIKKPLAVFPKMKITDEIQMTLNQQDLQVEIDRNHVGPFLTELVQHGVEIESISVHEPTLEDFFVHSARQEREKKT
jgi:ABC-type multidrug transport system ATPase subunit